MKTTRNQITAMALIAIITLAFALVTCDNGNNDTHTHDWQWTVKTAATYDDVGEETATCTCGATNSRPIPKLTKATPTPADYTIGNLIQVEGFVTAVTITPNAGSGTATAIYYNGSETLPQTIGTYPVTFDVAATTGWNAANGLSAGSLEVGTDIARQQTPETRELVEGFGSVTIEGFCTNAEWVGIADTIANGINNVFTEDITGEYGEAYLEYYITTFSCEITCIVEKNPVGYTVFKTICDNKETFIALNKVNTVDFSEVVFELAQPEGTYIDGTPQIVD